VSGLPPWSEPRSAEEGPWGKRADAARRRDVRADVDDQNARLESQYQYDQCFLAVTGEHAPKPVVGMSARTYQTYCLNKLKQFSDDWRDKDLTKLDASVFALADRTIRADAIRVGNNPQEMSRFIPTGGLLREVRKTDRTGRVISEFVGPVDAPNGAFAPFTMPAHRARFNADMIKAAYQNSYK
jgi:hypothetical protein